MSDSCIARQKQERTRTLRGQVIARDGGGCFYCDEPGAITLDHIIPKARGGKWELSNLVMACETCNQRRGTLDAEAFLRIVRSEKARGKTPVALCPVKRAPLRNFRRRHPWMASLPTEQT